MLRFFKSTIKNKLKGYIYHCVRQEFMDVAPYFLSNPEERASYYALDFQKAKETKNKLLQTTIERVSLEERELDYDDFCHWLRDFPEMENFYAPLGDVCLQKLLEHYVSHCEHNLKSDDIFIDIAASGSPYADILHLKGIEAYRLDISYPAGIHDRKIGANAAKTGLPGNFCNAMSAHCAFECFSGDADIKAIAEAGRILRLGGKFVIVPLYLADEHIIEVSPFLKDVVPIDNGAKKVWRDDIYLVPFARSYSPDALFQRLLFSLPKSLSAKIVFFLNAHEVVEKWPVKNQRVYLYFMLVLQKDSVTQGTANK